MCIMPRSRQAICLRAGVMCGDSKQGTKRAEHRQTLSSKPSAMSVSSNNSVVSDNGYWKCGGPHRRKLYPEPSTGSSDGNHVQGGPRAAPQSQGSARGVFVPRVGPQLTAVTTRRTNRATSQQGTPVNCTRARQTKQGGTTTAARTGHTGAAAAVRGIGCDGDEVGHLQLRGRPLCRRVDDGYAGKRTAGEDRGQFSVCPSTERRAGHKQWQTESRCRTAAVSLFHEHPSAWRREVRVVHVKDGLG